MNLDNILNGNEIALLVHLPMGVVVQHLSVEKVKKIKQEKMVVAKSSKKRSMNPAKRADIFAAKRFVFNCAHSKAILDLGIRRQHEQGKGALLLYHDNTSDLKFNWLLIPEIEDVAKSMGGEGFAQVMKGLAILCNRVDMENEFPVIAKNIDGVDLVFVAKRSRVVNDSRFFVAGEIFV